MSSTDLNSRLCQRITIQAADLAAGAGGHFTVDWDEVAEVWAEVIPLDGRYASAETLRDEQVQSTPRYRITIRYRSDVTSAMRILYGDRILQIRSVVDDGERHETLVMLADAAAE